MYEAAWPTNLGVDVKMRAHGFAAPNWDNLNDFVIVEIQLKNTGFLDMNMDGKPDTATYPNALKHDIKALAFQVQEQSYMSISSYACGGRCVNDVVPTIYARQAGWVNDADSSGSPWAFSMMLPSATTLNAVPGSGNVDIGFNGGTTKNYMDLHHGWVMIDVKSGGLPSSPLHSTASLPSKQTIFGTHPIGTGAQRGWYVSGGSSWFVGTASDPRKMFYITTGVWYANGGQLSHNSDFNALTLSPNPNFFASGTTGLPLTFVPKGAPARPNGDFKSQDHFDQVSYEDGTASAGTNYTPGWGKWTTGCSNTENFDADMYTGVGPFDLKKDSTITIVFATVAGYRLEGIQRAVRAARWAYENDYQIPKTPPLPNMKASNTLNKSVALEWDAAAETDAGFAGYKIWKSSQFKKLRWLDEGMRVVDYYQDQMTVGPRPANLYKPVNPKFDAFREDEFQFIPGNVSARHVGNMGPPCGNPQGERPVSYKGDDNGICIQVRRQGRDPRLPVLVLYFGVQDRNVHRTGRRSDDADRDALDEPQRRNGPLVPNVPLRVHECELSGEQLHPAEKSRCRAGRHLRARPEGRPEQGRCQAEPVQEGGVV